MEGQIAGEDCDGVELPAAVAMSNVREGGQILGSKMRAIFFS